ncbi:hypothetical protein PMKS-000279 [Pichia membranifaciens]|uniref:DNA-(apurinic or apyrimidinic site) lyase n=1 Tax=Pichia membranifaciens TaxID=4926 RepID=A0A1Q2YBM0_9ASCO|nr:hypothetical protein PMKS-000279 [Pichia membranifaciens]
MHDLYEHWSQVDIHFPSSFLLEEAIVTVNKEGLPTPPDSGRATPEILSQTETTTLLPNGVRILSQDPWETLVSFIISSNNNIKRISQLCETLCIRYGKFLGEYNGVPYYTFPKPGEFLKMEDTTVTEIPTEKLAELESQLRELGFGYRAKYITKTVKSMIENPQNFKKLCTGNAWASDEECVEFLRQFDGVGPKVADCVALMGCGRHDLVPVDTHVWNILKNSYKKEFNKWVDSQPENDPHAKINISKSNLKKALSKSAVDVKMYPFVKQFFRDFWGLKSGWAQAVVFAAEVKLDNGINHVDDVVKLISKVGNCEIGNRVTEPASEPVRKKRKTKVE